jgi:hypothetical protein
MHVKMVVSKIAKKAENVPEIPFQLNIKGMDADRHEIQAWAECMIRITAEHFLFI